MKREEAIKVAGEIHGWLKTDREREALEALIPELRESEDERIKKIITDSVFYQYGAGVEYKDVLDYLDKLEKQKEQRLLSVSAASEWLRKHVCNYVNSEYNEFHKCVEYDGSIDKEKLINDFEKAMQKESLRDFIDDFPYSCEQEEQQQEKKEVKFVFPKFLYARTANNKTIDVSYAPQSLDAVEYIRSDYLHQEQKPWEWGEEETKLLDSIIDDYEKAARSFCGYDGKIGLLRAIRDGEYNLPKPAWSEEDEKIAKEIEEELWYPGDFPDYPSKEENELYDDCQRRLNWFKDKLKSLRPQPKQETE